MDDLIANQSPSYQSSPSLDEIATFGDRIFPMLYLYFRGRQIAKMSGDVERGVNIEFLHKAAVTYIETMVSVMSGDAASEKNSTITDEFKQLIENQDTVSTIHRSFTATCSENRQFLMLLSNKIKSMYSDFDRFLPQEKQPGGYYTAEVYSASGMTKHGSFYPIVDVTNPECLHNCMLALNIMFMNGIIDTSYDLGIRPINIITGQFVDDMYASTSNSYESRVLGLPSRGVFSMSSRPKLPMLYHTFNGTNLQLVAILKDEVLDISGCLSISWSIHREKQSQRTLGKDQAPARAKGSRTIAGTMIFTLADHHPLLELMLSSMPKKNASINNNQNTTNTATWSPQLLSDDIPAFDLMGLMTNEYGNGAMFMIYGIEFMDEGGVLSIDNATTEMVFQYTARAMDPIMQVNADENGQFDFFGVYQSEYMNFWRRRNMAAEGVANSDLEGLYTQYYDSIFSPLVDRRSLLDNE